MDDTSLGEGQSEIDRIRAEQRCRWQAGDRVLIEDYLRRRPDLNDSAETVLDLIFGEYVLREELGDRPQADDYYRHFPAFRERLERLFRLDEALIKTPLLAVPDVSVNAAAHPEETTVDYPRPPKSSGSAALDIPRLIGKYPVVSALDEGGQGQVFRAVHPTLGRDVVIKLGRQPVTAEGAGRDRLLREGKLLAELDHPNLARVYDFDVEGDRPYLVMECVVGRTLEQYARQEKPAPAQAARLVAQAARALAVAHRHGVTHLDVKPQNLLIDDKGQVRVIDFGLARLERYGQKPDDDDGLRGTVTYMAPEQARKETARIGPRSDVYALGGVLYFLLVGKAPHVGRSFLDALEKASFGSWNPEALQRAGVPARLQAICRRALAPEPEQRYAGAEDLAADLERFAEGPRRRRRMLLGAGLGVVVLAALAGLMALAAKGWRPQPAEPPRAQSTEPILEVQVWRKQRYRDLTEAAPVHNGEKIRIEANVPAGLHATLFLRTSEGQLRELAQIAAEAEQRLLAYPEEVDQGAPLVGPMGTELVLLCARRDRAVTLAEVEPLAEGQVWPALPEGAVLRLTNQGVRRADQDQGRDLGPATTQANPEGEVRRRLEVLRSRLAGLDRVEGLAFAHSDVPLSRR